MQDPSKVTLQSDIIVTCPSADSIPDSVNMAMPFLESGVNSSGQIRTVSLGSANQM